jgi:hypothetical protein
MFDRVKREARKAEYTTEVEKHLRQLYGHRPPEEHIRAACVAIAYAGLGHPERVMEVVRGRGDVVTLTAGDLVEQMKLEGLVVRRRSLDVFPFDPESAADFERLLLRDDHEGEPASIQYQATEEKVSFADRMERAAFTARTSMAIQKFEHAKRTGNEIEAQKAADEMRKACQKYPRLAIEAGLSDWIK